MWVQCETPEQDVEALEVRPCASPRIDRWSHQRCVSRKDAWPFYGTIAGVRLCWELEEPEGPKGSQEKKKGTRPSCMGRSGNSSAAYFVMRNRSLEYGESRCGLDTQHQGTTPRHMHAGAQALFWHIFSRNRGTSLTRKRTPLEPYRRPIPRVLQGS